MPRILIVEDEPDIALAFKRGLESRQKFSVDTFESGREALANFNTGKYDFALLDVKLIDMSGFVLCRELLKRQPNLKFCFLTGFENTGTIKQESAEFGDQCFLMKPISIAALVEAINTRLNS